MITETTIDEGGEIQRLQSCISDLVSLLALPIMWSGRAQSQVLDTLLDALLGMLRLDFVYARLNTPTGPPIEACRTARRRTSAGEPPIRELGRALARHLAPESPGASRKIPDPIGRGELSIARFWLGLDQETGVVVAGSQRADFPTDTETLLLRVAVNQAVIELQRDQVMAAHHRAREAEDLTERLGAENIYLRQELNSDGHWDEIVGRCNALKRILKLVEQVAPTNACVLIQGETGTGKELIARAVHRLSGRHERAFTSQAF